jgi:hypothetical protein
MHDYLLKVPNTLFYDNKISSGYKKDHKNKNIFLGGEIPCLFVNHEFTE